MQYSRVRARIIEHRVASSAGLLSAQVIEPSAPNSSRPLVALHGISRNARELVELFLPEAERTGRRIVVPHFDDTEWPVFQRPTGKARPDQALLALMLQLALNDKAFEGPVDMFGHSGGAQLAHRFAMLYPQKVGRLHLAAAGWYCLPDTSMNCPYGIGADETPGSLTWARRYGQALPTYLRLSVRVYVGTLDTQRNNSLRQNQSLDQGQGPTRVARAETYVERFRAAAFSRGILPDIGLTRLPGVTHDVAQAMRNSPLGRLVTDDEAICNALVS